VEAPALVAQDTPARESAIAAAPAAILDKQIVVSGTGAYLFPPCNRKLLLLLEELFILTRQTMNGLNREIMQTVDAEGLDRFATVKAQHGDRLILSCRPSEGGHLPRSDVLHTFAG
jgi:hypothetical protein